MPEKIDARSRYEVGFDAAKQSVLAFMLEMYFSSDGLRKIKRDGVVDHYESMFKELDFNAKGSYDYKLGADESICICKGWIKKMFADFRDPIIREENLYSDIFDEAFSIIRDTAYPMEAKQL